ncbi:MAG: hypothetical protein MUO67_09640 [Anaerolineales bacterium]|nr:hypothetical protein [Anaerolineales bacterium]
MAGWRISLYSYAYPAFLWDNIKNIDLSKLLALLKPQKLVLTTPVLCMDNPNGDMA